MTRNQNSLGEQCVCLPKGNNEPKNSVVVNFMSQLDQFIVCQGIWLNIALADWEIPEETEKRN